jgi:cytoskeletal protein RodZ
LKALGEFLRQAREAKGLSLQDVQEVTKIRLFFLESIEKGDFNALPGQAYVKGFLRNYAKAVDISEQEVIDRYNQLIQEQTRTESSLTEPSMVEAPIKTEVSGTKLPSVSKKQLKIVLPAVIIIMGMIAGFFGIRFIVRHGYKDDKPVTAVSKQELVEKTDLREVNKDKEYADILRVEATEAVWIRLTEQETGRIIEEVTLKAGDTRQWKINHVLTLLNGNAGGLKISDKGEPFKFCGNKGEVVTMTIVPPDHAEP